MESHSELIKRIQENDLDGVKLCVEQGTSIHYKDEDALIRASMLGHIQIVEYLVDQGANIHVENEHALKSAIHFGNTDVAVYLIEKGADITTDGGYEALKIASLVNRLDIVKYLVDVHNVRFDDTKVIRNCVVYGNLEVVKFLVQRGLNILDEKYEAIKFTCIYGHIDLFKFVIDQNHNIFEDKPFNKCLQQMTALLSDEDNMYYTSYINKVIKYFTFCKKIHDRRCQRAAKLIYFWWIPICYDVTRPCGQRMALKNLENYQKLCAEYDV